MKKLNHFQFPAKLIKGDIVPNSQKYTHGMLALHEDCDVIVHIERRKKSRSKEQVGYYWGVVLPYIAEHTGYLPEDLHEIFKSRFLRAKKTWRGTAITTLRSTSDLSTSEMAEYLSSIILEANEMGIQVPE